MRIFAEPAENGSPRRGRAALCALLLLAIRLVPAEAACLSGGTSSLPSPTATHLTGPTADLAFPTRLATDSAGKVYVTDPPSGSVVVRAADGRIVERKSGLGYPVSIAVDARPTIYVGDGAAGRVSAYTADWQILFQLGRGDGEFGLPSDIAVEPASGAVWVADSRSHLIRVYDSAGRLQRSIGGRGSGAGQFNFPVGIFVDAPAEQVLVVDQLNYRIQVFDLAGNYVSCLGRQGSGAGRFAMAQGVWADVEGRIYVADSFEGWIQIIDRQGAFVGTVGDFGAGPGRLRLPLDVVIDRWNRLVVTAANNSRLEVFDLGGNATIPAVVAVEPDPLDRGYPQPAVVVYVESDGYPVEQIAPGTVVANGVAANASPVSIGDHDGDGIPDVRLEFDWAALLATLPESGQATVTVTGSIAGRPFEGSAQTTVASSPTCAGGTTCSLRGADPQCNDAVCVESVGCTVQARADATPCDDGDTCTGTDACQQGVCVGGAPLGCDDGNPCTDDSCALGTGCMHRSNTAGCDDGDRCSVGDACRDARCVPGPVAGCDDHDTCTSDSCDPGTGCIHTSASADCDDDNACTEDSCDPGTGCVHDASASTGPCDDGDPGTVGDTCDGAGGCRGQPVTGSFSVVRWPAPPPAEVRLSIGASTRIAGSICADRIVIAAASRIEGDVVAAGRIRSLRLGHGDELGGDVVTGGSAVVGLSNATVRGRVDTTGSGAELGACLAAGHRAGMRWRDFVDPLSSSGVALGDVNLGPGETARVPPASTLGPGTVVVDAARVALAASATLTLVGDAATQAVILRVTGPDAGLLLGRGAAIRVDGLAPEQVVLVVDGAAKLRSGAVLAGTLLARGPIRIGQDGSVAGAVLGASRMRIAPGVTIEHRPFAWW